jgi:nucleoside-diphosphate-sugar epimerase
MSDPARPIPFVMSWVGLPGSLRPQSTGFGALPERPLERPRTADLEQAHAQRGWAPATSLDEGLRRRVNWCRTSGPPRGVDAVRH